MLMRKILATIIVVMSAMFGLQANAQNVMQKGTNLMTVGLGITNNVIPISVAFDHGMVDNLFDSPNAALSLGGMAGAEFGKNYNGFFIGPRVGLHYHFIPQLDTYFALMLGLESGNAKYEDENIKVNSGWVSTLGWGVHLGARYFFTPAVGMFAEIGGGYSFANIGIAFKL